MSQAVKNHAQIRLLRSKGLTYSELNKKLGVNIPKSSLNYICKEVVLTPAQKLRIQDLVKSRLAINRQKALAANRKIQAEVKKRIWLANSSFGRVSKREAKIALALLYLGEGSKRSSYRGLALGNSNPEIIKLYLALMKRCYGFKPIEFKCRVLYRMDQDLGKLEKFWSRTTGIPRTNFYKTTPDKRTSGKPTLRPDYMGVCVLYRRGTEVQLELQAIADIMGKALGM